MKLLYLPGHCISIELEELQQVLSLLPVPGLLLGRQGVIRHKQGVGTTAWQENISEVKLCRERKHFILQSR